MTITVRNWRLRLGGVALCVAAVAGFGGPLASADPIVPVQPTPGYAPAVQPVGAPLPASGPQQVGAPLPAGATPGLVPVSSGTLRDYFAEKRVRLEPQRAADFTGLKITLPMPPGWTQVPDPNVPDAFAVIADRRSGSLYTPNAQLVVYRLVGPFDPAEAITHGYVDCQKLLAWQTTNASLGEFNGFPSSAIEGTYRENDMTLNTSHRHVIAPSGTDNYLVSLTVTTGAGQAVANAPATDAIVNGFRVDRPGTVPAAPLAPGPPAAPGSGATAASAGVPAAPPARVGGVS